jgi:hypothetical protein
MAWRSRGLKGSHLYIRKVIESRKAAKFSQHKILLVRCDSEHGELRELTLPAVKFWLSLRRALTSGIRAGCGTGLTRAID